MKEGVKLGHYQLVYGVAFRQQTFVVLRIVHKSSKRVRSR